MLIHIYALLSISRFITQFIGAYLYYRQYDRNHFTAPTKVIVLIPSYREDFADVRATIDSCIAAMEKLPTGSQHRIVYIEDDVSNDVVRQLRTTFSHEPDVHILCCEQNRGKREAQALGYNQTLEQGFQPDFVMTIDSDTIVDPWSFLSLVGQMRPNVGGATGNVAIHHSATGNLLQKFISMQYFLAFNYTRAAQSQLGDVLGCSGAFSCYRADLFETVLPAYTSQMFLGVPCTFGDDGHLTNLILAQGYATRYDYRAIAFTAAPSTLKRYAKQQIRWSKTFFRESYLRFGNGALYGKRHFRPYTTWETLVALSFPFLWMINITLILFNHWQAPMVIAVDLLTALGVGYLRSLVGVHNDRFNRRRWYTYFPVASIIRQFAMMPLLFYALFTITDSRWGTR